MQENIALRVTTSPIERAVKMVWGVAATLLCVVYTAVLSCVAAAIAPFSQNMLNALARFWARLIMLTCGARVEFQGLKNLEGVRACVLVGNHESYFDIFALLAYLPREIRFMAKKEWLKLPVFGFALK